MQDQEKKFLGGILYVGMLLVCFAGGVAYQFYYNPIPVTPQVIEVTKLVNVPSVIETTKVVEVQKDCPIVKPDDKGWFK
jgi:hypothetical protein